MKYFIFNLEELISLIYKKGSELYDMEKDIDKGIEKYTKVKLDLLMISKCIECCESESEKETFQNIAIEYSKELRRIYNSLEQHGLIICSCCKIK